MIITCEVPDGVGDGVTEGVAVADGVGVGVGTGYGVALGVAVRDGVGFGFGATEVRGVADADGDTEGAVGVEIRGVTDTEGVGATEVPAGAIVGATVLAPAPDLVPKLVPRFGTSMAPGARVGVTSAPMSATDLAPRDGKMAPTLLAAK